MLNLLKYEAKKNLNIKIILLLVAIAAEILFMISVALIINSSPLSGKLFGSSVFILVVTGTVSLIVCGFSCIENLHKELNSKQCYMLFMTPNSSYKIMAAKFIESLISISICSLIFSVIAFFNLTLLSSGDYTFSKIIDAFNMFLEEYHLIKLDFLGILTYLSAMVSSYLELIGLAVIIETLRAALFNGKNKIVSLITGCIFLALYIGLQNFKAFLTDLGSFSFNESTYIYIVMNLAVFAFSYLVSSYIMEKKLSV